MTDRSRCSPVSGLRGPLAPLLPGRLQAAPHLLDLGLDLAVPLRLPLLRDEGGALDLIGGQRVEDLVRVLAKALSPGDGDTGQEDEPRGGDGSGASETPVTPGPGGEAVDGEMSQDQGG